MEIADLYELVESVVHDFQEAIENEYDKNESSNKVIIYLKEEYPNYRADTSIENSTLVFVDSSRIVQVITNLLSNSVKFSNQLDSATITLTTGVRMIDGKSMAIVSISDQGQGIKAEIVPR